MIVSESKISDPADAPLKQVSKKAAGGAPVVRIEAARAWFAPALRELWEYQELMYFLVWRDVKVRYKQTAIGATWAVFQPLVTMVIFTIVFRMFANVPSDGFPYPVFSFTALLPWNLFSNALTRAGGSVVGQAHLVSKVYFPRLVLPISATIAGLVDFAVAFAILLGMMAWYGIGLTWAVLLLPFFVLFALLAALAIGLWLAAINVRYRDVVHTMPLLVQLWMYMSPVAYPISVVPDEWRLLYSLNPMAGVISGFRWTLLGGERPDFVLLAVSLTVVIGLFFGGVFYFKRMEQTFADVV